MRHKRLILFLTILLQTFVLTGSVVKNYAEDNIIDGELIVLFQEYAAENDIKEALKLVEQNAEIKKFRIIDNYVRLELENEEDILVIKEMLKKNELVDIVENNYQTEIFSTTNDEYSSTQWPIYNPGKYTYITSYGKLERSSTKDIDMDAFESWALYGKLVKNPREVIVAVIDTGIDYQHTDLDDVMWRNPGEIPNDGIDNDGNGYVDDVFGWDFYNNDSTICHYSYNKSTQEYEASPDDLDDHGTHIAGIIAAKANNKVGIAGIASCADVKIMSLKINGGKGTTGSVADAIEAIKYAQANGAMVCNISWGVSKYHEAFERTIRESNMLFVCAAGNSGTNNDRYPVYPASFELDNVISVTYINAYGNMPKKANYGPKSVDIAAPGEEIFSTIVGSYKTMSGTSMAAPHVTAEAALLFSTRKSLYPANVKEILTANIKKITDLDHKIINPGIPDMSAAIIAKDKLSRDLVRPTLALDMEYSKDKIKIMVDARDEGGSGVRVIKYMIGKRTKAQFQNGAAGVSVTENEVYLMKSGYYTFYVSDYAGNETLQICEVIDDVKAPELEVSYNVANNYKSIQVDVKATDTQSGVKQIKYMKGSHSSSDFLAESAGSEVRNNNGVANIRLLDEGVYTIYTVDYRGNKAVKEIDIKIIKSTSLQVYPSRVRTLSVGDRYEIIAQLYPVNSTDKVSYISSDPKKASVSTKGVVYAKEKGSLFITVKSSSGKKVILNIEVE